MAEELAAITGTQLVRLLRLDGWQERRGFTREGIYFSKRFPDGTHRSTAIAPKRRPLAAGTLSAILGPKQTALGRVGLRVSLTARMFTTGSRVV
ncbi:MAG TPA: hypothetical protein VK821_07795 [Dehalococcoidia bacterium]|nr:hypothetical protein [Dehalococcoidia bacterium]